MGEVSIRNGCCPADHAYDHFPRLINDFRSVLSGTSGGLANVSDDFLDVPGDFLDVVCNFLDVHGILVCVLLERGLSDYQ